MPRGAGLWPAGVVGWVKRVGERETHAAEIANSAWVIGRSGLDPPYSLCYTAGIVFPVLDHRRPHFQAIWHLFVIAGCACHYVGIFLFVACAQFRVS